MFANCIQKRLTQEAIPKIFRSTFCSDINPCSTVYHNDAIGTSFCNIAQNTIDNSINTPVSSNTPSISGTVDSTSVDIHTPTDKNNTPKSQNMHVTSTPKSTVHRKRMHTESVQAEINTKVRRSLDATVQVDTSSSSRTPRKLLLRRKLKSLRQAFLRQQRREASVNTNKTRSQMKADRKKCHI
jgi:hypothetical protein